MLGTSHEFIIITYQILAQIAEKKNSLAQNRVWTEIPACRIMENIWNPELFIVSSSRNTARRAGGPLS